MRTVETALAIVVAIGLAVVLVDRFLGPHYWSDGKTAAEDFSERMRALRKAVETEPGPVRQPMKVREIKKSARV